MVSRELVRVIEVNSECIADRVIERMRRDVQLLHLRTVPDAELREWCDMLLRISGHWLAIRNEEELAHYYEMNGRARFAERLPLQEAVHVLFLMRDKSSISFRNRRSLKHGSSHTPNVSSSIMSVVSLTASSGGR